VRLTYKFENPIEILCNQALQRGDFVADLADEVDEDGNTLTVKSFTPECWEYLKTVPPGTQDSDGFLKVRYLNGIEVERYLHAEPTVADTFYYWRNTDKIDIGLFDKVSLNMSVRYGDDVSGVGYFLRTQAQIRLTADDGTFWSCHVSAPGTLAAEPGKFWEQAPDGTWTTLQAFLVWEDNADFVDFSQWNQLTFDCPPAPRSGKIEVILVNSVGPNARTKDFSSLQFIYTPYIDGSYNVFDSQSDISTRDGVYFTSIEDEVFIGNAPRPLLKGALLKKDGDNFPLAESFYEGQQFGSGVGHLFPYGELRVRAYHNQFRNGDETYRLVAQGLSEGAVDTNGEDDHQDLIHRYFNRDIEPSTNVKCFQLVNQDVDLRNCEWTGTLIKNFDLDIGFVDDTYTFEYGLGSSGVSGGGGGGGGTIPPGPISGVNIYNANGSLTDDRTVDFDGQTLTFRGDTEFFLGNSSYDFIDAQLASDFMALRADAGINIDINGTVTQFTPVGEVLAGSVAYSLNQIDAGPYLIAATDHSIECTANSFTVTLPDSAPIAGRVYFITNSGAGTITLDTTSAQTFVNVSGTPTSITLGTKSAIMVQSNGSEWLKMSGF
jgi:hypothetical protein